ncbi:MAG: MarR family transcriptional regulator [Pseudomonadota bacterium]
MVCPDEPASGLSPDPTPHKRLDDRWRDDAMPFVEQFGFLLETQGHPRGVGRVLGWMMVCEPPWQSVAEIAVALQASRSAVNAVIHRMAELGVLQRVAIPGERSTFFRLHEDGGSLMAQNLVTGIGAIRSLAEAGLESLAWRAPEANARLEELRSLHAFFERELPLLFERWAQEKGSAGGDR